MLSGPGAELRSPMGAPAPAALGFMGRETGSRVDGAEGIGLSRDAESPGRRSSAARASRARLPKGATTSDPEQGESPSRETSSGDDRRLRRARRTCPRCCGGSRASGARPSSWRSRAPDRRGELRGDRGRTRGLHERQVEPRPCRRESDHARGGAAFGSQRERRTRANREHPSTGAARRAVLPRHAQGFGPGNEVPVRMDWAQIITVRRALRAGWRPTLTDARPSKPWPAGVGALSWDLRPGPRVLRPRDRRAPQFGRRRRVRTRRACGRCCACGSRSSSR
jgi:hypothetical protein